MVELSEEEQVERLRKWWAENGVSLVISIVIGVAALMGWRHWQGWEKQEAAAASAVYETMMNAVQRARSAPDSTADAELARLRAEELIAQYPNSTYAGFARLLLARLAVEAGDLAGAEAQLQAVLDAPATDELGLTARVRLARVLVQSGELDRAYALVAEPVADAFKAQALEIQGDVLRRQDDIAGARDAYSAALELMDASEYRELVQMKLDDLVPAS